MDTSSPPMTILLIDDDDKDRTYYAKRIHMGIPECTVLEAKDGRSGLELYWSLRIDCIVMEAYLPDMSGFELLLEVVPRPSEPAIAVMMLTQAEWRHLNKFAMQRGVHAFFVKRFTSGDELVAIIQKGIARVGPNDKVRQQDDQILKV